MKTHHVRGFTLLELVISLTILSMVAVIIYATLNLGARAAERGEARSVENQRARAALALIARHLKSAYPLMLQAEGETFVYFFGEPEGVSFISAAGRPEIGGLEKITYFLREDQAHRLSLWVRTSAPTLPADLLNDREGSLWQETEVLPAVDSVKWEYFGISQDRASRGAQNEEGWDDRWDGSKERRLPLAVRFSWRARLGELPQEWHIEIPLNVYHPPPDVLAVPQGGAAGARRRRFRGGRGTR